MAADVGAYDRAMRATLQAERMAEEYVSSLVARILASGVDVGQALAEAWPSVVGRFGDMAAQVAVEHYAAQREAAGVAEAYEAFAADMSAWSRAVAAKDVEHSAGVPADGLARRLSGQLVRHMGERQDIATARNAARDPAHPRWAIVAHPGACAWCRLMSSNGWLYGSREAAERVTHNKRHVGCRCGVVADFDVGNPSLAGWDPGALQDEYARAIEEMPDPREQWEGLTSEERARYGGKYDRFKRDRIVAQMAKASGEYEAHDA